MNEPRHHDPYWQPGTIYQPYTTAVLEIDDAPTEVIDGPVTEEARPRWLWPIAAILGTAAVVLVLWLVLAGAHRGLLSAAPQSSTDTAVSVVYQPARLTLPPAPVAVPAVTAVHTPGVRPVVVHTHTSVTPSHTSAATPTPSAASTLPPSPPPQVSSPPTPPDGGLGGTGLAAPPTSD
jgi:hypothetical protein